MRNFSYFRNSKISSNIIVLIAGSGMAQMISIAINPILTRIYSPEDIGIFALFISIASTLSVLSTGKYEMAIMLPKRDKDAAQILFLCFMLSFFLMVLLFVLFFCCNNFIEILFGSKKITQCFYILPPYIFFTGILQSLNYIYNRQEKYNILSKGKVIQALIVSLSSVFLGFVATGPIGLIAGSFLGQAMLVFFLFKKSLLIKCSKNRIIFFLKKYINFPKFTLFASMFNVASYQLLSLLIPIFYSTTILGYYYLAQKILNLPLILFSSSIGQIFYREAIKEKNKTGKAINVFLSTTKALFIYSFFPFIILFFWIKPLFIIVFGDGWEIAGEYARIILVPLFINFIISPLSCIFVIFQRNLLDFIWQTCFFSGSILIFFISILLAFEFKTFLVAYAYFLSFAYISNFILSYKISKGEI